MPVYDFLCSQGHVTEAMAPVGDASIECRCGLRAGKVFLQMPLSSVSKVEYTSPVDGRPVLTKQARLNDLARHDCIPYEPGMRQDAERRRQDADRALDAAVDATVESEIHRMPARKREQLAAELSHGVSAEVIRL